MEIYRITHIDNLDYILKNGIYCRNSQYYDSAYKNIGDLNLIDKRKTTSVPVEPKGVLNDYVPFYLGRRSPMLYKINKGSVEGVTCTQPEIIYLVSTLELIEEHNIKFVFTDGHAYQVFTSYFNDKESFNQLDWPTIGTDFWANTLEDNDRMRRKQAEFLVYQYFPVSCIFGIATYDDHALRLVNTIINNNNLSIPAKIKNDWYY